MRYIIVITIILGFFYGCVNQNAEVDVYNFQIAKAKIALYKANIHQNLYPVDDSLKVINFLQADLGMGKNDIDSSSLFFDNDTLFVIHLFPSFKNKSVPIDIIQGQPIRDYPLYYGVAFKNKEIKFLVGNEDAFFKFNEDINRRNGDSLTKYIANKLPINNWLLNEMKKDN